MESKANIGNLNSVFKSLDREDKIKIVFPALINSHFVLILIECMPKGKCVVNIYDSFTKINSTTDLKPGLK